MWNCRTVATSVQMLRGKARGGGTSGSIISTQVVIKAAGLDKLILVLMVGPLRRGHRIDLGPGQHLGVRKLTMIQQWRLKEKTYSAFYTRIFPVANDPGYSLGAPDE